MTFGVLRFLASAVLCLVSSIAWAQAVAPPPGPQQPTRGRVVLTPTLTVLEGYDDNFSLDNTHRQSDVVTSVTSGVAFALQGPVARLAISSALTARLYAEHERLDDAFASQTFAFDGSYRPAGDLTLSLNDTFRRDNLTNLTTPSGIATGNRPAWSNTVTPGLAWRAAPQATLRLLASHTAQRFEQPEARDSDDYRTEGFVDHALTPTLTGTAGYQFGYIRIARQADTATHTPRVGLTYRVTETLTASLSVGPTFVDADRSVVIPAVTASLQQRVAEGALRLDYDRRVTTAGGLGGTVDTQSVAALAQLTTLVRHLTLELGPRYAVAESSGDAINVRALTLGVRAAYRLARTVAVVGSYTFFRQRSGGTLPANDVDQNRVFVGLELSYPTPLD